MNSWRDEARDALAREMGIGAPALPEAYLDAVFDALGIVEDGQDKVDGYFMLHGGKRKPCSFSYKSLCKMVRDNGGADDFLIIPMTDKIRNAGSGEEAMFYLSEHVQKEREKERSEKVGRNPDSVSTKGVKRSEF